MSQGASINDITQCWPKINPPPTSVMLKWVVFWWLSQKRLKTAEKKYLHQLSGARSTHGIFIVKILNLLYHAFLYSLLTVINYLPRCIYHLLYIVEWSILAPSYWNQTHTIICLACKKLLNSNIGSFWIKENTFLLVTQSKQLS